MPLSLLLCNYLLANAAWIGTHSDSLETADQPKFELQMFPKTEKLRLVHIAKTGGASFKHEAPDLGYEIVNAESCIHDPRNDYTYEATFIREPTSHVQSEFMHCLTKSFKYNNTNFPTMGANEEGIDDATRFERTSASMDAWLAHFEDWELEDGFYHCYHPQNMQARQMTCDHNGNAHSPESMEDFHPDVKLAKKNLQEMFFVGLTEEYNTSMCVFQYQMSQEVADYCFCGSSEVKQTNYYHTHGIPAHSVADLSKDQVTRIQALTTEDKKLYEFAQKEFWKRVKYVEDKLGKKISKCNN